jgi:uncharacterized protein with PIN domain
MHTANSRTLLRTLACSLASFKSNGARYGFRVDSSLSSLASAIRISTFPTSSNSLASVEVGILTWNKSCTKAWQIRREKQKLKETLLLQIKQRRG